MAKRTRTTFNPDPEYWNPMFGRPRQDDEAMIASISRQFGEDPPQQASLPPSRSSGPSDIRGENPVGVKIPSSTPAKAKRVGRGKGAPQIAPEKSQVSADLFQSGIDPGLLNRPDIGGTRALQQQMSVRPPPKTEVSNPGSIRATKEVPEENSLKPSEHFRPYNSLGEGEKQRQDIYHGMIFNLLTSGLFGKIADSMREASTAANAIPPLVYARPAGPKVSPDTQILQHSPVELGPQRADITQSLQRPTAPYFDNPGTMMGKSPLPQPTLPPPRAGNVMDRNALAMANGPVDNYFQIPGAPLNRAEPLISAQPAVTPADQLSQMGTINSGAVMAPPPFRQPGVYNPAADLGVIPREGMGVSMPGSVTPDMPPSGIVEKQPIPQTMEYTDPSVWNFVSDRKRLMAALATLGLGGGIGAALGMGQDEQPPDLSQLSQGLTRQNR